MNCGQASAREAGGPGLGLSARNFGYNSVDLRVCICAPEAFVYYECVCLSIGFAKLHSASQCVRLPGCQRAPWVGVLDLVGSGWNQLRSQRC